MKRVLSRTLAAFIACLMFMSALGVNVSAAETSDTDKATKLEQIKELLSAITYDEYSARYSNIARGTSKVTIKGSDYNASETTAKVTVNPSDVDGSNGSVLVPEEGDVTFNFNMQTEGMYKITIEYYPYPGRSTTIERALLIDGKYPFKESRYLSLSGVWKDKYLEGEGTSRGFELDMYGNELRPTKTESPEWRTMDFIESTGYYLEPFEFYISAGDHTLTLGEVKEPIIIKSITLQPAEDTISYSEYKSKYDAKGAKTADAEPVRIQAEHPDASSAQIIYPLNDRTSAITEPQDPSLVCLNTIGGDKWQTVGDWVRWSFTVPETGYYRIALRYLQNFSSGLYVSRKIKIDGEVPFAEAKKCKFNYNDDWSVQTLGNGETEYEFYLEAGKDHMIEMEVVLGDMADILHQVEVAMTTLNNYYLKILMLTGPTPDIYRTYKFDEQLPEVFMGLQTYSKLFYKISDELEAIIGSKGENSVILDNTAFLLSRMNSDYQIAKNFSTFKDYIGSLGTWIMNTKNQPLLLDYIEFTPAGSKLPQANANFWQAFAHEFSSFIMSFFADYNSLGAKDNGTGKDLPTVETWIFSGRDQTQIVRSMINDDFMSAYNIKIDLKLVAGGTLLPATLSGTGPDIALSQGSGDIINYAIRSAVMGINPAAYEPEEGKTYTDAELDTMAKNREIFSDYDQIVAERYDPSALIPLTLYGKSYGLPETQSFSMLFYRMDILAKIGIEVPETWDDVYAIIPALQNNNLQFGMPNSLAGTLLFMYQKNEPLYKPAVNDNPLTYGMQINLDSNVALDSFKQMCEFITMYNFPKDYDFANRFRSGEMPIGIADYTTYSLLTIFAPEIRGLWEFTLIPGTPDASGQVNHSVNSGVSAVMMMRGCKDVESAWTFMKWWTGEQAQGRYGNELLALLGPSGRHPTANLNALYKQPWPSADRKNLEEGFKHLTSTPEMPGGYIISRDVQFAFLKVYNDNTVPIETLLNYIEDMNKELSRKREEFNLPTLDDPTTWQTAQK